MSNTRAGREKQFSDHKNQGRETLEEREKVLPLPSHTNKSLIFHPMLHERFYKKKKKKKKTVGRETRTNEDCLNGIGKIDKDESNNR